MKQSTKMPKKATLEKSGEKALIGGEKLKKLSKGRNTRSRAKTTEGLLSVGRVLVTGGDPNPIDTKAMKPKRKSDTSADSQANKVARRINFDDVNQAGASVPLLHGSNNNAKPATPRVDDQELGSEYESDEEVNSKVQKGQMIERNQTISDGEVGQPKQGGRTALADNDEFNAEEYQAILKDKTLMRVFDHLLKEKVEIAKKEIMETASNAIASGISIENSTNAAQSMVLRGENRAIAVGNKAPSKFLNNENKSPSDTTLYAPAVKRREIFLNPNTGVTMTTPLREELQPTSARQVNNSPKQIEEINMMQKISDFIDTIRISEKDRSEAGSSGQQQPEQVVQKGNGEAND